MLRGDLPAVHQAIQGMHACHEAGARLGAPKGSYLIAVTVPDEPALLALHARAEPQGAVLFREPDLNNSATAVAVFRTPELRTTLGSFPLWRPLCPQPS